MDTEVGAHSDITLYQQATRQSGRRPSYKGLAYHTFPEVHEAIGEALASRLAPRAKVLDIAAGSGAMCRRIKDLGFSPSACDLVSENFNLHGEVPFWKHNLNSGLPPEAKDTFDAVVATDIIEHLENPRYFLRECFAALRPGGLLLMTTPNVDSHYSKALFVRSGHFHWFEDAPISVAAT